MNAGLTNLDTLRKALLGQQLSSDPQFDSMVLVIGLGIAAMFERATNRRLAYAVSDSAQFSADRSHFILPRYPINGPVVIATRSADADEWEPQTGEPVVSHVLSGMLWFGGLLGDCATQASATWSGGYWFEQLEPDDDGYPSAVPEGATLLPDDLRAAFLMQCESIWAQRDKLGASILEKPAERGPLAGVELLPLVRGILKTYTRFQLS